VPVELMEHAAPAAGRRGAWTRPFGPGHCMPRGHARALARGRTAKGVVFVFFSCAASARPCESTDARVHGAAVGEGDPRLIPHIIRLTLPGQGGQCTRGRTETYKRTTYGGLGLILRCAAASDTCAPFRRARCVPAGDRPDEPRARPLVWRRARLSLTELIGCAAPVLGASGDRREVSPRRRRPFAAGRTRAHVADRSGSRSHIVPEFTAA